MAHNIALLLLAIHLPPLCMYDTFKPIIYAASLSMNYSNTVLLYTSLAFSRSWSTRSFDDQTQSPVKQHKGSDWPRWSRKQWYLFREGSRDLSEVRSKQFQVYEGLHKEESKTHSQGQAPLILISDSSILHSMNNYISSIFDFQLTTRSYFSYSRS